MMDRANGRKNGFTEDEDSHGGLLYSPSTTKSLASPVAAVPPILSASHDVLP